jgi:hypothetical protein
MSDVDSSAPRPAVEPTPDTPTPPHGQSRSTLPSAPSFAPTRNFNLGNLGLYIDRWADVIEGRADLADTVRANVLQALRDRNLPDIQVEPVKATASLLSESRPYIVTTTSPGVTTAIYIARHGRDLYVSWRTHVRGVWNRKLFIILAGLALVPTLCVSPCLLITNAVSNLTSPFGGGGGTNIPILAVLPAAIAFFVFELLLVALAGYFLRGDFFAYFFVEPTVFDAEDVAAMSLTVHKVVQDAVKKSGVETALLAKADFKGGRKSEQT